MFSGYLLIILFIPIFIGAIVLASVETKRVQSFHEVIDEKIVLEEMNLTQSSMIKDRNGQTITELHRPINRTYISANKIPAFLREIFIFSEDQHFYEHPGFDLMAIGRALTVNMKANEIEEGASTITQQLARNLYLTTEQSYNRKLTEVLYAYKLERTYSKEEILELYLNTIFFHNGAYGIEAAAQLYFQKSTPELSKAQLAFLAAIPNNPSFYDPLQHFERTKARQERLISQLAEGGYINREEANRLINEKIELSLKKRLDLFPDYTTFVEAELKELIAHSEGYASQFLDADATKLQQLETELAEQVEKVIASGIIINTALDPNVQTQAVKAINRHLPYEDIEGSATVIDHVQHEIIGLVGGKNYHKYDFHRAFQGYRQPGSAIKPLLVYAPYLERTKASLTEQIDAGAYCVNNYCPKNYGGANYGLVTLEQAFIRSYNTPAVRLLNKIGIENGFQDLANFQFKKVLANDHVLPAAIGGFTYGMTSLELTNAYTTFANDGLYQPARSIRQVTDLNGKLLYKWEDMPVRVWSSATVSKMRELLNKTIVSGTARKAHFPSDYIGGKTGTTNDYNDYWFIGLTEDVTAGVWIGKDKPANIKAIGTSSPHLTIWKEIVSAQK